MNRFEHKISEDIIQTAQDRELALQLAYSTEEERLTTIGTVTLAALASFQAGDALNVTYRLERLYASLSVHIEPYDDTKSIQVNDIDLLQAAAIEAAQLLGNKQDAGTITVKIEHSRRFGLPPSRRSTKPSARESTATTTKSNSNEQLTTVE
jgi:hypothetical protein